jgi:hypothetical protein
MTDVHEHAEPGIRKIKTMMVTRIEKNGHPGYRVESVANSVDYWPLQILEVDEVRKLCDDMVWQVNIIPAIPGRP